MNVEIRAEAVLFPEKEYISGIFIAVHSQADLIQPDDPFKAIHYEWWSIYLWAGAVGVGIQKNDILRS